MKKRYASRGPDIDTEKCVENALNNRFNLVIIAAQRAREIKRNAREDGDINILPCVSALLEIQEGKIDANKYLRKLRKDRKEV